MNLGIFVGFVRIWFRAQGLWIQFGKLRPGVADPDPKFGVLRCLQMGVSAN